MAWECKVLPFRPVAREDLAPNCFAGHVAAFSVDSVGDLILPGAFKDTLPSFLEEGFIAWQHDWSTPIGKPIEAREDARGLFVKAHISDTSRGRDALTLLRDGVITGLSIGYAVLESKALSEAEGRRLLGPAGYDAAMANLPVYRESIRALVKLKLWEASPVSVAANRDARVTGVKRAGRDWHARSLAAQFLRERIRWQALEARLNGVTVGSGSNARLHAQARREYIRFLRLEAGLLGARFRPRSAKGKRKGDDAWPRRPR